MVDLKNVSLQQGSGADALPLFFEAAEHGLDGWTSAKLGASPDIFIPAVSGDDTASSIDAAKEGSKRIAWRYRAPSGTRDKNADAAALTFVAGGALVAGILGGGPLGLTVFAVLAGCADFRSIDMHDEDGDGYTSVESGGSDCDDNDPLVYPGAEEIINGKDDDCDGRVDNIKLLQVSVGSKLSCGRKMDNSVVCWDKTPSEVYTSPNKFKDIDTGNDFGCGVRDNGQIECWGENASSKATPPMGDFTKVSVGESFACGLRTGGEIVCWGNNDAYQLRSPEGKFIQIDSGPSYSCALGTDYIPVCWGYYGPTDAQTTEFLQISTGVNHACGLTFSGAIECWGKIDNNQAAGKPGPFIEVSASNDHTCGLLENGAIECWGVWWDTEASPHSEVPALLKPNYRHVSVGDWTICAIRKDDNGLECSGDWYMGYESY